MKRFRNTERLVWTMCMAAIALCVLSIALMREDAAPVLTATLPAMLALAGAFAGITNWAEVRFPNQDYYKAKDDPMGRE